MRPRYEELRNPGLTQDAKTSKILSDVESGLNMNISINVLLQPSKEIEIKLLYHYFTLHGKTCV